MSPTSTHPDFLLPFLVCPLQHPPPPTSKTTPRKTGLWTSGGPGDMSVRQLSKGFSRITLIVHDPNLHPLNSATTFKSQTAFPAGQALGGRRDPGEAVLQAETCDGWMTNTWSIETSQGAQGNCKHNRSWKLQKPPARQVWTEAAMQTQTHGFQENSGKYPEAAFGP